jgi:16S rRNA (guanine(966)-N(2))-methyltransferase RsmD
MRVISGKFKGRKLKSLAGPRIRPTSDRLKETLFNILRDRLPGATFLDCFAGSGAIGIEALSRGAQMVFFIENDSQAARLIDQNLAHCQITQAYKILRRPALAALEEFGQEGQAFDLIFVDPPYASDLYEPTLRTIARTGILQPDGLVVVEHFRKKTLAETYGILRMYRTVAQGDSSLTFYATVPLTAEQEQPQDEKQGRNHKNN